MFLVDLSSIGEVLVFRDSFLHVYGLRSEGVAYSYEHKSTAEVEPTGDLSSTNFVQHKFSSSFEKLAAITEDKKLLVWNWQEKILITTIELPKRPTCLSFLYSSNDEILVADKYGDVYRCFIREERKPKLLLGHLSMILDMVVSSDDKYVVTSDRDEKIRISCFPNSYSIKSYCLGHTKLISKIAFVSSKHLISCSADSTLRLWNFPSGKELQTVQLSPEIKTSFLVNNILFDGKENIILSAEKSKYIWHLQFDGSVIEIKEKFTLRNNPWTIMFDHEKQHVIALLPDENNPVIAFRLSQKVNSSCNIDVLVTILKRTLPSFSFGKQLMPMIYWNLLKPDNIKRPAIITPEATINLDSILSKKQKVEEIEMQV